MILKKGLTAGLLLFVSLSFLPSVHGAELSTAQKFEGRVATSAKRIIRTEPTGVMGWAVIRDSSTGERFLPMNYDYAPPRPIGYPSPVAVTFQSISGGTYAHVSFSAGEGITVDAARSAWKYRIDFSHVPTMTGPPSRGSGSGSVRYNPALWRYVSVVLGAVQLFENRNGQNIRVLNVALSQRGSPFPDLPNP